MRRLLLLLAITLLLSTSAYSGKGKKPMCKEFCTEIIAVTRVEGRRDCFDVYQVRSLCGSYDVFKYRICGETPPPVGEIICTN